MVFTIVGDLARSSPSWGLLHHHRHHLARRSESGPITIAATAFTDITIIVVAVISSAIDHRHGHHRHHRTLRDDRMQRATPQSGVLIAELSGSGHSIITLSERPCGVAAAE